MLDTERIGEVKLQFDVVIIGVSSAGLYASEKLAKKGYRVAVFEQKQALDHRRRTYIITNYMDRIMDDHPDSILLHDISMMAVQAGNASVNIKLRQPDLIIERGLLIRYFAQRAREAGAALFLGHRFRDIAVNHQVIVETPSGDTITVKAKTVIGADGVLSQVAEKARIERPPFVHLLQAEVRLPNDWLPDVTKVWFDVDETPYFFWLIPESDERAVVGLIADNQATLRPTLDRFLKDRRFEALDYQAGQAAMHHPGLKPWGKVGQTNVFLVGDAAGHVKVTTVGGTVTGFRGADAVVRAITEDISYRQALRPLKRELDLHWFIRSLLEQLDTPGYEDLIQQINPAVKKFLAHRNRDRMAGGFWRLALLQPRFLWLGAKLITRWLLSSSSPRLRNVDV
jgi:flavin-dependent dehydrogenase